MTSQKFFFTNLHKNLILKYCWELLNSNEEHFRSEKFSAAAVAISVASPGFQCES